MITLKLIRWSEDEVIAVTADSKLNAMGKMKIAFYEWMRKAEEGFGGELNDSELLNMFVKVCNGDHNELELVWS